MCLQFDFNFGIHCIEFYYDTISEFIVNKKKTEIPEAFYK